MYSFQVYWYIFVNNCDLLSAHIHLYLYRLPNLKSMSTLPNSYRLDSHSQCCTLDYKVFPAHNSQFVYRPHSDPRIHLDTHIEIHQEGFGTVSQSSYEYQTCTRQYHHTSHPLAGIQQNKGSEIPFGKTHNSHYRPSCSSEKLFENSINKDMNIIQYIVYKISRFKKFNLTSFECWFPTLPFSGTHFFSGCDSDTHFILITNVFTARILLTSFTCIKTRKTFERHCLLKCNCLGYMICTKHLKVVCIYCSFWSYHDMVQHSDIL